ncbi:hypothetical protein CKM354_000704600 [Cercospora kikuchii]|uniref:4'-phosphopantetheinyl transferase domain-containing protein n=1 Tax=Cercospora kikuchii TaxID=84275 RepID=A0A9P3FDZ6_9PEZI|nr:uncharacterized protein CKM354_000704600 [Cercospora kikuchii]GIZ43833.1 hypothetical protein CKM354_000704600 [Cercospora kikuchii]
MPPRPFPYAFRVGTDIVLVSRIREIITKPTRRGPITPLDAFLRRTFTGREIIRFWKRNAGFNNNQAEFLEDPVRLSTVTMHLAGRWAAKEAAIKAVKPRKLTLMDVEILQYPETKELFALIRDRTYVHQRQRLVVGGTIRLALGDSADSSNVTIGERVSRRMILDEESQPAANGETSYEPTITESTSQPAAHDEALYKPIDPESTILQTESDEMLARSFREKPTYQDQDDDEVPGQVAIISISHDGDFATAVCVAPQENLPGDVGGEAAARLLYDGDR